MDKIIDDEKCPHCGGPRHYSSRYSAFYCASCEVWFGHYCPGEECDMCDMCPKLPPKPPKMRTDTHGK